MGELAHPSPGCVRVIGSATMAAFFSTMVALLVSVVVPSSVIAHFAAMAALLLKVLVGGAGMLTGGETKASRIQVMPP